MGFQGRRGVLFTELLNLYTEVKYLKNFFTYEQQLQKLKSDGLIIPDESYALRCLKQEGYYNLINGYSKNFKSKNGYVKGTSFNHIVALYKFDQTLRSILYKYTSIIECHVKALIAHEFSRNHGVDEKTYLADKCFTPNITRASAVTKLIETCNDVILHGKDKSSNRYRKYIDHNIREYGHVPFWVLVRALSFGTISIFYDLMLTAEKEAVANEFGLTSAQLANILEIIVQFRNIVAHGERTFCAYLPKVLLSTNLTVIKKLSIAKNKNGENKYGRKDILALLISCKYLLPDIDYRGMIMETDMALDQLKKDLDPTAIGKILTLMGLKSVNLKSLSKVTK